MIQVMVIMHNILHTSKAVHVMPKIVIITTIYTLYQLPLFIRSKVINLQFADHLLDTSHYQMVMR